MASTTVAANSAKRIDLCIRDSIQGLGIGTWSRTFMDRIVAGVERQVESAKGSRMKHHRFGLARLLLLAIQSQAQAGRILWWNAMSPGCLLVNDPNP
jgi:hypothetical protein